MTIQIPLIALKITNHVELAKFVDLIINIWYKKKKPWMHSFLNNLIVGCISSCMTYFSNQPFRRWVKYKPGISVITHIVH